jgi:hypothetical protein
MGDLLNSFKITNLDLESSFPTGFKRLDTITNFSANNTGTPTNTANPGSPTRFFQRFIPNETYLQYVKDIPQKSNLLNLNNSFDPTTEQPFKYTIFDATNLDIEKSGVDGGIPYKQVKDPTVYPTTTQKRSPSRGPYPIQGQGASKYDQVFSPQKTYLEFIKKYI